MTALLDLDSLKTLVMIADAGSFTRAAEKLDKTQSAVSMQMRRMEDKLERTIFRREGRHSKLTEDGELLLRHARQMLRLNDETLALFSEREISGKVRLGLAEDIDEKRTAKIIFEFTKNNPKAEASIICAPAAELRKALDDGLLDLAIIGSLADEVEVGEGSVLASERLVWAAGSNFKIASEKELPLAVGPEQCSVRKAAVEALKDEKRAFRIQYSSSNPGLVEMTAANGMAITIQPRSSIVSSNAGLLELEGLPKLPNYVLTLVRGKESHLKAANALSEHLAKSFGSLALSA
ncbi:LysR family transcriptional regulator [Pseudovibrio sp. Tun.PSC04-5.I4]|uniref:LysR family transcriptional regulator n=1 Tax=Pseudovibrio sp. Tun.PSC04-5.I4 TaxID=1798213 RepID=UPI00088B9448|nr:LysR family transcriptional regulator [Pseudovibrio sp. Tun.PSC04-5.I4]SDQ77612.1 DNA-binding transcriptional regulator, LysR family [Pseudovibrio sp. Tun.PSC04-5.I4]